MKPTEIDVNRKFVRVLERRPNGLVEFEFAIGEPELYVEMLLPEAAFAEFCETNRVATLPPRPASDEEMAWTLREASRLDTPHGQD
ncbi:MAG: phenol hydroxylase subunit [Rhodocyclaceae bacterium]|nr:phenol hydroxylase subunit [Rhodocyclaceae bacterium]